MYLSDHFTFDEMTRTQVRTMADQNKAVAVEYIPSLKRVCDELLEPIRELFSTSEHEARVYVHSAFRYAALNEKIGGSPTSAHMRGEAVDFDIDGHTDQASLQDALGIIMASPIQFGQLLIEYGCLHISLPKENGKNGEVGFWDKGKKTIIREAV